MKYIVKLEKVIERTVVVDAKTEDEVDKLLVEGKYEYFVDRVTTPDVYTGFEYITHDVTDLAITSEQDLKDYYGTENIERLIYKFTVCGCGYRATKDYVAISGYAENSGDAECPEHRLYFPFTIEEWDSELLAADAEGCELWKEYNEEECNEEE